MSDTPLPRLVKPKDHAPLTTVEEACAYLQALPESLATLTHWQHAAGLCMGVRSRPSPATLEAFTQQLELALFLSWRLDIPPPRPKPPFDLRKKPPAPSIRRPGHRRQRA